MINGNLNQEEWKSIPGFHNYESSNMGNIRRSAHCESAPNKNGKLIKWSINPKGYLFLGICNNRKKIKCYVHRLVALTWIPNPDNLPQIDHINEIKTDNRVENLRWVTNEYNLRRSQSIPVKGTNTKTQEEKVFLNSVDAAKYIGGDHRKIQQIYDGKRKTHKDWTFVKLDIDPKELIDQL